MEDMVPTIVNAIDVLPTGSSIFILKEGFLPANDILVIGKNNNFFKSESTRKDYQHNALNIEFLFSNLITNSINFHNFGTCAAI